MTTVRDVVTQALRLGKVLASGDEPSSDEAADGLTAFQSMMDGFVSNGMFGQLNDLYKTDAYSALEGDRVTAPSGVVVTFPSTYQDAQNGGNRAPRDLACIETIIDGVRTVKIWDRVAWVSVLDLTLNSDAPLAGRGSHGLAAALACHGAFLASFGDADVSPRVERLASNFLRGISCKFGSTHDDSAGLYF